MNDLLKKGIAEFIGTFFLVVFGVGTAILTGNLVATALAFGFVLLAMYYTIGKISGCHINPAVTVAMLVNKSIKAVPALVYIACQIIGAIAGAYFLKYAFNPIEQTTRYELSQFSAAYKFEDMKTSYKENYGFSEEQADLLITQDINNLKEKMKYNTNNFDSFGTNAPIQNSENGKITSLLIEVVLTFTFVLVVCRVSSQEEYSRIGGLAVGVALALVHLLGISLTGTSVNPARSIGPAIVLGKEALSNVWIFIVGPVIGGILASLVNEFAFSDNEEK